MHTTELRKVKQILRKHGVRFAYLFGSRAEGRAIKSSDYDFAVYFGHGSDSSRFDTRMQLIGSLQAILGTDVDLIVLEDIHSVSLKHEVVMRGKIIYEKDQSARIDFELRTRREFADFEPFLNAYNQAYITAGAI